MARGVTAPGLTAWWQLRGTYYALSRLLAHRLAPLGIAPEQVHALHVLRVAGGPLTIGQLAGVLPQEPQGMTPLVDKLERQGWARRVRDSRDRRVFRVELLAAGVTTLHEALSIEAATIADVFRRLTDDDLATLQRLLQRIGPGAADVPTGNRDLVHGP